MAETRTARMGQPIWGAGSDSPSRADFNEGHQAVEDRTAYDTGLSYGTLPVTALIAGRYAMVDIGGDGYSLYRYSAANTWQYVGGSLVSRFQRYKALEGQAITDPAFAVEHPDVSQPNPNIIASYGGDFTAGGVLKSWNANDSAKGALVVGWNGSITLGSTGRAYIRTRENGDRGLVLHAHGSGASDIFTVREPGGSDMLTVDAIGRLSQRTFAGFGGASPSATSMVAIAPTSAVDAVTNGLLLYGQSAAAAKTMFQVWRDSADTAPLLSVGRDAMTVGRLAWTSSRTTGTLVTAANNTVLRASGWADNAFWWKFATSDPTSPATEANAALDTTQISITANGVNSSLPAIITQRNKLTATSLTVNRVTNFSAPFVDLARLVPDGFGGETAQPASSWASDGRLATGAWWKSTGTIRDGRQQLVHHSRKRYANVGDAENVGTTVAPSTSLTYTWATMTLRSSTAADLNIRFMLETLMTANSIGGDGQADSNTVAIETLISVNAGAFVSVDKTETNVGSAYVGHRRMGAVVNTTHRKTAVPAGATFQLRTVVSVGVTNPSAVVKMLDIEATEVIHESYAAP